MPATNEENGEEIHAALDAFPNVLKKAQALWGTKECDMFLQGLFMDTRGGTRRGFPMDAAEEIMFLVKFNKTVRALPLSKQLNVPLAEAFRIVDKADQAHMSNATNNAWNDPNSSNEASARVKPQAREQIQYQQRPVKKAKKSGVLAWIVMIVLLGLAYKLLYPILKGGGIGG